MKKIFLVTICILILAPQLSFSRHQRLANEGKRGLYVRSIEGVLRLPEDEVDLATAAMIVSEQWSDMVHGRRYLSMLDEMAMEIQEKLKKRWLKPNYKAIPVINKYLFGELGFRAVPEIKNPNDLFLHSVLDNKRGYCLSLSILYLSLAERLGLPMYGVVVPGHFFVRYDDGRTKWNIETTGRGANSLDKHYIDKFKVPKDDQNSIYMKNLNKTQTLGCFFNNLGNAYSDIGNTEAAWLALERAVQINPTLAESRANLGNIYLQKGQIEDAIYQYRMSLQINPHDAKTYNNLGNAYLRQDWLDGAISKYIEALQLDPNFIDAYQNLAIAYSRQKRFAQAIAQLKQAISLEPKNASLYSQLGEVYYQMGDYSAAIRQYEMALTIKQDLAEAHYGLAICYNKLGLVDDEIRAYKEALTIKPDMLAALVNLGNAYFGKQDYDAAIQQYNKAVRIKPDDGGVRYNLGAAYSNKADYKQAVAEYLEAVKIEPKMGDAHYGLAFGFYKLKKYDLAAKHLNIAEKLGVEVSKDLLDAIKDKLR
ncbi:MAG: tetratricopeptide repeat protein [Phycisphaerae bacterium]